jgi:uncharacterized protein (TIRG00374 family)
MTENKSEKRGSDLLRILPGILVSLVALVIILIIVDWGELLEALSQAEYKYILLGIPVYLVAYVFRSLGWRTLLKNEIPLKDVFLTMQAGYLLNNVLPLRLGELGRAFLLGRKGLGFWRVFSTILVERAFDMILAAGLLLGTLPFVFGASQSSRVAYIVAGIVLMGMLVLHLLARNQAWAVSQYEKLSVRWSLLSRFGVERVQAFFNGLSALVDLKSFIRVLVWMVMTWGLTVVYHFIVLLAFDPGSAMLWAGFGLATAALGVALPSSPSYVGVLEAVWIGSLSLFDVPFSTALAYALTVHLLHIIVSCVFGIYALVREGESLREIYAEIRARRFN